MSEALNHYENKLKALQTRRAELEKRDRILSKIRIALFFVAAALLFFGYSIAARPVPWTTLGWCLAIIFLGVITWHEQFRLELWRNEQKSNLFNRLLARLNRDWDQLPNIRASVPQQYQALADDLDVTGRASLMHWLCFAETNPARELLLSWILEPPNREAIRLRQQTIPYFAEQVDLRERVYCLSSEVASGTASPERFLAWASSTPWLGSRPWLRSLSWIGCGLIVLGVTSLIINSFLALSLPMEILLGLVVAGIVSNVLICVGYGSHLHDIFQRISSRHQEVDRYRELLDLMFEPNAKSVNKDQPELLRRLHTELNQAGSAAIAFKSLRWRIGLAGIRHSALFFIPYLILQVLVAWDFRSIEVLENWQRKYGGSARGWFSVLAQFEAICSLAAIRFENPDWCLPEIRDDNAPRLKAQHLGHPLIKDSKRVTNDIEMQPNRPLWLVTGSNMSGKSTFLRALGINILLARTGAPVCAASFSMPPILLATSIRIRDSLDQGISYFMAELRRLREVVDIASAEQGNNDARVLFLLDEIMQGTNSRERHIAVGHVLNTLLETGAFGAVSTHDLDLVTHPLLEPRCNVVHFRELIEQVGDERRMTFDYKMRTGPTPTTNALRLLALVGLGDLTDNPKK